MSAIITKAEMTQAVNGVLAATGFERESFADRRDSAILLELSAYFTSDGSPVAAIVTAQVAEVARELEDYVRKFCHKCDREFWVIGYLAHRPKYQRCGREDCVQASARAA